MRNYIILNGVNSNTITGLLISTLPPITKPKQRTQIEEIDGRDGDIVTKLGYSAYDKEIEIGLYGDFDIDDVIAYFNSEGTVTFSNEPDKYYNYQILDQIDYEKLIRFKKAKIKMHVQPFKYPTEEEQIQVDATVINQEGSNLTLQYTSINEAIEIIVEGDTEQNGTPTPTTPVAVETVTGNQTITVCGKNLFDKSVSPSLQVGTTTTELDTGIRATTTATGQNKYTVINLPNPSYLLGKTLTISANITPSGTNNALIRFYWLNGNTLTNLIASTIVTTGSQTITIPSSFPTNNNGIAIVFSSNASSNTSQVGDYVNYTNIQIEKGSTATEYEPYQSQTYNINLGSTELCKIGDYQDRIYKNNGKWYLEKQIGRYDIDTTKITLISNYSNIEYANIPKPTDYAGYNSFDHIKIKCNSATWMETAQTGWNTTDNINKISGNADKLKWWLGFTKGTGLANIKSALNNSYILYPLATPTTTEITDTTLLEQLEALEGAKTYENTTNILVEGSLPAILNATTQGMPNTTINNIGNIYAKPLITIYGSGNIGVYLNQIQVLQIDLGNNGSITIDVSKMEAYNNSTKALMNRLVTGDYMKFLINSGENNIAFSGNVAGFTMDNYTRWL